MGEWKSLPPAPCLPWPLALGPGDLSPELSVE